MKDIDDLMLYSEQLYQRFEESVRNALIQANLGDIKPTQAILLYRLGDMKVTVGQCSAFGIYNGHNASYNIARLVELGFLDKGKEGKDRRLSILFATDKAVVIRELVEKVQEELGQKIARLGGNGHLLTAIGAIRFLHSMVQV